MKLGCMKVVDKYLYYLYIALFIIFLLHQALYCTGNTALFVYICAGLIGKCSISVMELTYSILWIWACDPGFHKLLIAKAWNSGSQTHIHTSGSQRNFTWKYGTDFSWPSVPSCQVVGKACWDKWWFLLPWET